MASQGSSTERSNLKIVKRRTLDVREMGAPSLLVTGEKVMLKERGNVEAASVRGGSPGADWSTRGPSTRQKKSAAWRIPGHWTPPRERKRNRFPKADQRLLRESES